MALFLQEHKTMDKIGQRTEWAHQTIVNSGVKGQFSLPAHAENMKWNLSAQYNEGRAITMLHWINCTKSSNATEEKQ